jgi:TetR/AcrR family acrAB operon transcriptional repressor
LGTLREMAVMGLTRLARDARTQAVFDVMYHKCEFTADLAPVACASGPPTKAPAPGRPAPDQAVARGQLPSDADTALAAALKAFMVGVMHEWVQNPVAYDLERTAPVLIDTPLADSPPILRAVRADARPRRGRPGLTAPPPSVLVWSGRARTGLRPRRARP